MDMPSLGGGDACPEDRHPQDRHAHKNICPDKTEGKKISQDHLRKCKEAEHQEQQDNQERFYLDDITFYLPEQIHLD